MEGLSPALLTILAALTLGLAGGAHCALMCGPLCAACVHRPGGTDGEGLLGLHGGRIIGYSLLGIAAGSLGALAPLALGELGLALLRTAAALALIGSGAVLLGWRGPEQLAKRALPLWQRLIGPSGRTRPLLIGIAWAALPCGLLYSALFLTMSSGSPLTGALAMGAFALGTIPATYASALTLIRLKKNRRGTPWARPAGALLASIGLLALLAPWAADHGSLGPAAQWLMSCLPGT